jgi:hypothetical protein
MHTKLGGEGMTSHVEARTIRIFVVRSVFFTVTLATILDR